MISRKAANYWDAPETSGSPDENSALTNGWYACGTTLLHLANNAETAALLLNSGADVNAVDHTGRTPLHHAVMHGREDVARLLLASGGDVNAAEMQTGRTPLFYAASREMVDILLAYAANISSRDTKGRIPLHKAAEDGHVDVVQSLISLGADVNDRDYESWTPLHYAARWPSNDLMVGVLLFYGADSSIMNRFGMTSCDLAVSRNCRPIVPILKSVSRVS